MNHLKRGYSVIEILVVVGVFAVLAILATQSVMLSLRSSKKSSSVVNIKQELDYAASSIERILQTASSVEVGVDCVTSTATRSVTFRDSSGYRGDFACLDFDVGFYVKDNDKRIASSSGEKENYKQRLTSSALDIKSCEFNCHTQNLETYIDFTVRAVVKGITDTAEGADITTSRKILIRRSTRK